MTEQSKLPRASYPFASSFYAGLDAKRASFCLVDSHVVPPLQGFGFRVEAGRTFRFAMIDGPQIIDACLLNADDPNEYYSTGPQLAIEGGRITRDTRLWGSPPRSRPLATCIADTVNERHAGDSPPDHICHTDCCSAHLWLLYTNTYHRPCYDNMRDGLAMLGLSQRAFQCNINLFMSSAIDPRSGNIYVKRSNARAADYLEFYAEVPLHVAISVCPSGAGDATSRPWQNESQAALHPIRIEIYDTQVQPLGWPLHSLAS
jgi:uncharacterized protein YcgI (DUF1989 family)